MDFLKRNYGVLTPKIFRKTFEFCKKIVWRKLVLGKDKAPSEKDCENMLYLFFNKLQLNLAEEYDRGMFNKFFVDMKNFEKNANKVPISPKKNKKTSSMDSSAIQQK